MHDDGDFEGYRVEAFDYVVYGYRRAITGAEDGEEGSEGENHEM